MQDLLNSNPNFGFQNLQNSSTKLYGSPPASFKLAHYRWAHSEMNFRLPNDRDLVSDPFDGLSKSFNEIKSEDDIFCTYMDIKKIRSREFEIQPREVGDGGFVRSTDFWVLK
ncbi:unnamed protein product [Camellia sinensis]